MTSLMTTCKDWRELPFSEIWCVDTEFYPGTGRANGGRNGDPITPHCLVALEMRSGRTVRLRPDEFGPFPPYRLDSNALFIAFANTAEYGVHVQRKWGQPACAIDAYVEFRHYVNDGRVKNGEREKGFYGLGGALRFFCDDCIDAAHKDEMRDQILRGPPFDAAAVDAHVQYCEEDTRALARLVPHIVPTIRSLPHAMLRADFQWASALHEQRGIPIDLPKFERIRDRWDGIQLDLVREHDRFGIYEIVDGKPHWREHRFADVVRQNRWSWPTRADGSLDQRDETFKQMGGRYRQVETLRELRYSMSKLRLNDLAVGNDGRCRTPLWAYGTKTARNAPSNSQYIFGPAKWVRFLITPPPGRVLVHRDFKQQEVRIAAILSGDAALLQACESGDVYLGIAEQLGFVRDSMSPVERRAVRALFKTVVLGIQYGLGAVSLAVRTGISLVEACEILARLKARFHVFEAWAASVADHAGLDLEIGTPLGWYMQTPPGINSRTVRNFPIQATAAEVLHVACILAERRGIEIIAPVHDALMAEGPIDRAEELSIALDRVMRDAAAIVLRGYELPTDTADLGGPIFPGQHFFDERGAEMWKTVTRLAAKQEERWA
jgi:DNA polymerase family A